MRVFDERLGAVLVIGSLSSIVLLASSSLPPSVGVSELWMMDDGSSLTVSGVVVSLRVYDSGSEVMVISDGTGDSTVRVVCSVGPGRPPSALVSIGDLLEVSGECAFNDGIPAMYCRYGDVRIALRSEEVLTVYLLSTAWHLFEGDRISIEGLCAQDASGATWLRDIDGACSIMMSLAEGLEPFEGRVLAEGVLVLDSATMSLVLEVSVIESVD